MGLDAEDYAENIGRSAERKRAFIDKIFRVAAWRIPEKPRGWSYFPGQLLQITGGRGHTLRSLAEAAIIGIVAERSVRE
jgi:hypothetical protein